MDQITEEKIKEMDIDCTNYLIREIEMKKEIDKKADYNKKIKYL